MKLGKYIIIEFLFISLLFNNCLILGSSSSILEDVNYQDLENNLDDLLAQTDFNCISVGIIRNDQLAWVNSFGSIPNNPNLIYGIASITKCFTATAILQLHDRDMLNLSDDVSKYLPFQLRNPNHQNTPITIKMLLSHTSGLAGTHSHFTNFTGTDLFPKVGLTVENYPPLTEFLETHLISEGTYYSASCWSTNAPGTVFRYSNTGYGVLGYIIENISHQNLTDYFQSNIYTPLNMSNIGFSHLSFNQDNLITPYHWDENLGGDQGYYMELPLYSIVPLGNTGLMASIPDLAKFFIAHMNEGLYGDTRLFNTSSVNLMHTPILSNYGMGWHIDPEKGQGHTGEEWGYRIELRYFPPGEIAPEKIGIIFMGNVGGNDMSFQKDSIFISVRDWIRDYQYNTNIQVVGSFQTLILGFIGICVVVLLILKHSSHCKS